MYLALCRHSLIRVQLFDGFILLWEQELQELGHIGHKAGQSRSLTEHIIEDHAEFWCLCLAIPQVYISDSVDEWYDEDTHESE